MPTRRTRSSAFRERTKSSTPTVTINSSASKMSFPPCRHEEVLEKFVLVHDVLEEFIPPLQTNSSVPRGRKKSLLSVCPCPRHLQGVPPPSASTTTTTSRSNPSVLRGRTKSLSSVHPPPQRLQGVHPPPLDELLSAKGEEKSSSSVRPPLQPL